MSNDHLKRILLPFTISIAMLVLSSNALAAKKIRIASVSWTGVTVKSELAVSILDSLGYDAKNTIYSVPFVYAALSTNAADVFFGNGMPSMDGSRPIRMSIKVG